LNESWVFTCASWQKAPGKLGFSTHEHRPATVPGQVHVDLMNAGIIADPFERCQELGCQWVDHEDWSYRREFEWTADGALPRQILRFEGLDTVCRVYLNEQLVAESDNMFVPLELDVTEKLITGTNQLRVDFDSALRVGEARRRAYFQAQGLKEDTVRLDARAFVRKAQYMYGWDWGPSLISAGIYRPVSLIEHAGRIKDVRVEQRHDKDGTVSLRFTSELELPRATVAASQVMPAIYHYVEGFEEPVKDGQWQKLEQPRLWWPNGMGRPELYEVISVLCVGVPRSRQLQEDTLDRKVQRIGLRELTVQRDSDEYGRSFRFVVNGRDVYALGANWIPDDNFTSRIDPVRLRAQLERAVDLQMNMLRVWGGGFYETDEFYDFCDELGLLVWQDFPYACSYYPDDAAACAVARLEATSNVKRLRNHASLALWCGNNENRAMRDDGWDGRTLQPPRFEGERIYDEVLPELLEKLDPERLYIPSSPFGEGRANSGKDGDQHFWDVWHGRGDWRFYLESDARFCSEFGFASAPGHAAWKGIEPKRNLLEADVRDPVARWHDKTAKGYETFLGFVELHYPKSATIEEWTYFSQLNQRDALRFGIEHYRRSAFCRGTLIWQLNDCWPVQSWAVVDSFFHYKAAAFELRRLYAPLLTSLERVGDRVRLWAILDNVDQPVTAEVSLELRRLGDGRVLSGQSRTESMKPGERRVVFELDLKDTDWREWVIVSRTGSQESFLLLAEPKELTLPALPLTVEVFSDHLSVTVPSSVVDLCLWDAQGEVIFLDNFVTQLTPGTFNLRYRGTPTRLLARSLGGLHEVTTTTR
jgi:beta-mannosidase